MPEGRKDKEAESEALQKFLHLRDKMEKTNNFTEYLPRLKEKPKTYKKPKGQGKSRTQMMQRSNRKDFWVDHQNHQIGSLDIWGNYFSRLMILETRLPEEWNCNRESMNGWFFQKKRKTCRENTDTKPREERKLGGGQLLALEKRKLSGRTLSKDEEG